MPGIEIHPSCDIVQTQLNELADTHRLTVICGLIVPHAGEIALVQTIKSADAGESLEAGIKMPQGGVAPGEDVATALQREAAEELGIDPACIRRIVGLPISPVMTGGRARGGKPGKAFGVLCATFDGEPATRLNELEIAEGGWCRWIIAERRFREQAADPQTRDRGERSLQALHAIFQAMRHGLL